MATKHSVAVPRPEFPRPDLERTDWMTLNGEWEFRFDDGDRGLTERYYAPGVPGFDRRILVPFCYQSASSGLGIEATHETVWYRRSFRVPTQWAGRRLLLKFGAVDYRADVWVNGTHTVTHEGGYTPFEADITPYLGSGDVELVVRAWDPDDAGFPRGKQSWRGERFGCWYTPCTGIWQSVWVEAVGESAIRYSRIDSDVDRRQAWFQVEIDRFLPGLELRVEVSFAGSLRRVVQTLVDALTVRLAVDLTWKDELDPVYLWWPDRPNLFDVQLILWKDGRELDRVKTYFGMRKIEVVNGTVVLNGVPFVQKLILDQGYWPDSLLTPPSDEALVKDIELSKAFGFNGARKHQKAEDPRYYYHADRLGLLVWAELPSAYRFSDTAMTNSLRDWQEFIRRDRNHPSIVTWVPLNESWGVANILTDPDMQNYARALYRLTKALDPSRLVSGNDGWEQVESDLCAIHDYTASGEGFTAKTRDLEHYLESKSDWRLLYARGSFHGGEPLLLTEYGGIAFSDKKPGEWGYNDTVGTEAEFLARFASMSRAALDHPHFQGVCYTQLTDVQQEVNGLTTPDRKPKVDPGAIRAILAHRR